MEMDITSAMIQRPVGLELYHEMLTSFDYSQITWTMMRYNKEMIQERADSLLRAFLQWAALVPARDGEHIYVMLETPVEDAFHAFVLNTKPYQEFCDKFYGYFFHHTPLRDDLGPDVEAWTRYTVELLEETYGNNLHPELKHWRKQLDAGTFKVACVKCK